MFFLASLICVCLFLCLGLFFGLKFSCRLKNRYPSELLECSVLYLSLLFSGCVLCGLSYIPLSFLFLTAFSGLLVVSISALSPSKTWKYILSGVLCFASVLSFYKFSDNLLFYSLALTAVWGLLWAIFVFFERFPITSSLVSLAWTLGIVCVGSLLRGIPQMIIAQAALLGTSVMVFSHFKLSQKKFHLGKETSFLVGFLWAGVWTYFVSTGAVFQTITAYGYYLFEGIFLSVALLTQKPQNTFWGTCLAKFSTKSTTIVFSHLLILSFLSMMTVHMTQNIIPVLVFSLIIILIDLYMRLNALEHPVPTWREIFRDTKNSMITLVNEVKMKTTENKGKKRFTSKKSTKKNIVPKGTKKK